MIRGILRVTELLSRNSEAQSNVNFQQWFTNNVQENSENPAIKELYEAIVNTSQEIVI